MSSDGGKRSRDHEKSHEGDGTTDNGEAEIKKLKALIAQRVATLQACDAALEQKAAVIQEKGTALEQKAAVLQEKDAALQEKDAALQEKDAALQEKDAIIQRNDAALQRKDAALKQMDVVIQKTKAALQQKKALKNGTYYTTFEDVWGVAVVGYDRSDLDQMFRQSDAPILKKFPYKDMLEAAGKVDQKMVVPSQSDFRSRRSTNSEEIIEKVWPCSVLESASYAVHPIKKKRCSEIAHLVPASPRDSPLFINVARWVFGVKTVPEPRFDYLQKLIQGSRTKTHTESKKPTKREKGTGLKHFQANKIRLHNPKYHYDLWPHVLIIPILSMEEIKAWDGKGYEGLFLVAATKGSSVADICPDVGLRNANDEWIASAEEIEIGRKVLEQTIPAMAFSLMNEMRWGRRFATTDRTWEGADLVSITKRLQEDFQSAKTCEIYQRLLSSCIQKDATNAVKIPIQRKTPISIAHQGNEIRVRKVSFCSCVESMSTTNRTASSSHPAPDPMLLAVKAAMNWSCFHGENLMARGELEDDTSDLSYLAMEQCWEHAEQQLREKVHDSVMQTTISFPSVEEQCGADYGRSSFVHCS